MVPQKFPILQKWKHGQKDYVTHHEPQLVYKGIGINTQAVPPTPKTHAPFTILYYFLKKS